MRQILQTPDEMRIVNPYRYGGGGGSPYAALLAAIDASNPTLEYNALREFLAGNYADTDAVTSATEWVSGTYPATQGTASAQPTFIESANGGHPAFRFDSGNWLITVGMTSLTQPISVLFVGDTSDDGTLKVAFSGSPDRLQIGATTGKWRLNGGAVLYGGTRDGNPHAFFADYDGASSNLDVDGVTAISGNAGSNDFGQIILSDIGYSWNGDIQVGPIIWDTPPTAGQIDAILAELEALGYVTLA